MRETDGQSELDAEYFLRPDPWAKIGSLALVGLSGFIALVCAIVALWQTGEFTSAGFVFVGIWVLAGVVSAPVGAVAGVIGGALFEDLRRALPGTFGRVVAGGVGAAVYGGLLGATALLAARRLFQ